MRLGQTTLLAALAAPLFAGVALGYEPLQPIDRNPSFLEAKVTATVHAIGEAINKQDFSRVREGYLASSFMTKRVSEQDMRNAFRLLIDAKVDLTRLDGVKPIMDGPPQEDESHQLLVSGHYEASPRLTFHIGFVREGSHLGLSKVDLDVAPAGSAGGAGQAPAASPAAGQAGQAEQTEKPVERTRANTMIDAEIMSALLSGAPTPKGITLPADQRDAVVAAIHAFTLGVTSRDMDAFLRQGIVSPRWQQAQTGAKLAELYRTTIERGADFAKFDGGEIIVPHEAVLDPTGELSINGLIVAADRERIGFRAGFEREGGTLKLINLLVARSRPTSP